jgi:phosphoenolpyruvate---glycerone phosphotransferase subunit DhaL
MTAAIERAWLRCWAAEVGERRVWLTDLDAAIGDGDHGINLDRGLKAVVLELADREAGEGSTDAGPEPGSVLVAAGRRMMGVVGGASGALYGRALVRAGEAVAADPDPERIGEIALSAAVDAIVALGKAAPGDKTMLDALVPAFDSLVAASAQRRAVRLEAAAASAEAGSDATVALVARKGRASYLGERSAGHRDPGAASSAILVRCLAHVCAAP